MFRERPWLRATHPAPTLLHLALWGALRESPRGVLLCFGFTVFIQVPRAIISINICIISSGFLKKINLSITYRQRWEHTQRYMIMLAHKVWTPKYPES